MKSNLRMLDGNAPRPNARPGFEDRMLRLVKGGARASGHRSGPGRRNHRPGDRQRHPAARGASGAVGGQGARAQPGRAVLGLVLGAGRVLSLRFAHRRRDRKFRIFDENIIGKTLWELPFDNMSEADWQTHLRQLEWRATFRDLEVRCVDRTGEMRWVSISGEPIFDEQDRFKGYRGTMRDITVRKQAEALAQKPIRFACDTLDALAVEVCVLDSAGTVIMANKPLGAFATGKRGIGAGVAEGANYLEVCDKARGDERADGVAIAAGIRRVIAGESPLFRHEYVLQLTGRAVLVQPDRNGLTWRWPRAGRGLARERHRAQERGADCRRRRGARDTSHAERRRAQTPGRLQRGARCKQPACRPAPQGSIRRLLAGLEPVTLTYGEVLYEPGDPIRHVYFPNDCSCVLADDDRGPSTLWKSAWSVEKAWSEFPSLWEQTFRAFAPWCRAPERPCGWKRRRFRKELPQ